MKKERGQIQIMIQITSNQCLALSRVRGFKAANLMRKRKKYNKNYLMMMLLSDQEQIKIPVLSEINIANRTALAISNKNNFK